MDVTDFLEVVYFSWLTGNNDMHLKNFSLYQPNCDMRLTPAYDMLNVSIANPFKAQWNPIEHNMFKPQNESFKQLHDNW